MFSMGNRVVIPFPFRKSILQELHNNNFGIIISVCLKKC